MQRKWFFTILAATTAVLAAGFIACGDDDDTAEEAEADVCASLDELADAIHEVQALTITSTVEDAEAAVDDLETAWNNVLAEAADLDEARVNDLDNAVAGIQDAVDGVSGEDTIAEAIDSIQTSIEEAQAARAEIASGVDC